jgi:hypothetical protein
MAVAIGIGMLAGMELEWSNKDIGVLCVTLRGKFANAQTHGLQAFRTNLPTRHKHLTRAIYKPQVQVSRLNIWSILFVPLLPVGLRLQVSARSTSSSA